MSQAYCFTAYGGPETQTLLELPVPGPGPGQLLVAVRAAGVNPADHKVRSGARRDSVEVSFPMPLGREASGLVMAVGDGVEGFAVGDEVFGSCAAGFGAYAEHTVLDAAGTAARPEGVSFADAATIPVAAGTAYDGVEQLALGENDTLLVIGAGGGVGTAVLQLARARGAAVVGAASEAKRELVESFGARWVSPDEGAGPGVTAVFDLVGGEVLRTRTPQGARLVSVADPTLAKELGGSGVTRQRTTAAFRAVAALVADGTLDVGVRRRFPLERAGEALALVESGHSTGKTVIEIG